MDHWFSKNLPSKFLIYVALVAFVSFGSVYFYVWKCLAYDKLPVADDGYELFVEPGTSLRQFINQLQTSGIVNHPDLLLVYVILSNNASHIKAGEYKISPGTTSLQLLDQVVAGLVTQYPFTIVEGLQTRQVLEKLQQHPKIKATLVGKSSIEIIKELNIPVEHLEGIFLPETYFFKAYTTDLEFLRRAYFSMQKKLDLAWQQRDPDCILKSPFEALILASIIEKESSVKGEYAEISGVYQRRLVNGMKLQADPTVIYALQDKLTGPLLIKHLSLDSAYNTYKFKGLPPTPIAIPSMAAVDAALHPAPGESLYFVATGAGDHVFSKTLAEHNKAVRKMRH